MNILPRVELTQLASSRQPSFFVDVYAKKDRGQGTTLLKSYIAIKFI